jgi:hypothetical protein
MAYLPFSADPSVPGHWHSRIRDADVLDLHQLTDVKLNHHKRKQESGLILASLDLS